MMTTRAGQPDALADGAGVHALAGVDAERDDAHRPDPDDGLLEVIAERRLAARREYLRRPAHLDHARLPRREHVVDDDAGPAGPLRVTGLLGLAHPQAAHIDGVVLGVIA